jgi:DNA-binding LacI/PurR family transcriptional regulator
MGHITLKQVANQAGVSYQTVSKVLNKQASVSKDTEARIWQAVQELGYRPNLVARSLRSQRTRLIGYSWEPAEVDQSNPILDRFLQSMAQAAEQAGYHLLAFPYRPGAAWIDAYRELIDTNRVDGFVLSSIEYEDPRIQFLQQRRFPFVAFGRSNPGWQFPFVDVNGEAGMRQVVEHLVERGHRRIAVLAWPVESRVGQNRMEGLMDGLEAAGLTLLPDWIARGEGSYVFGLEATRCWLDQPAGMRPTAIVAFSDIMAIGAMHAIQERGLLVGQDMAVTGFDDSPLIQYLHPGLTSVRQFGKSASSS